jgi:gliding motility-associated-like protein
MKVRLLPLLLVLWNFPMILMAQPCGISVDAGPDASVCFPGGPIQLNGSVNGTVLSTSWSPTFGLSNPNVLNPIATVNTTTIYTLTAGTFNPNINLITNGNFSGGNLGFTSQYLHNPTSLWNEGTYAVTNNPANVHPNFQPCSDHTGGGQMMVVNGSSTPGENIWCQTVPVVPNTDYAFSAWVASVISASPAQLQFSINGQLVGNIYNASSATCIWEQFFEVWNSGNTGVATICIVNQNTQPSGNDFALDDISFSPLCEETDEVTIEVVQIFAIANGVEFIDCNENGGIGIQLDGTPSSSGNNITYNWTTFNGNIVSGGNTTTPTVNAPGSYNLTVSFNDGITVCQEMITVEVLQDPNIPFALASAPNNIDCSNPTATVLGIGSSEGSEYTYLWTTFGGNILAGETTLTPLVDEAGTYNILVTNTENGCTATATVTITEDMTEPDAFANSPGELDCLNEALILDGFGSSEGNEFNYQWTTGDGNIVNGETTLEPEIDQPGTYNILVTNSLNGCTAEAEVTVDQNNLEPDVEIAPADDLNCVINELDLDATGSNNIGNFTFQWSTFNGNITEGENTLQPTINLTGTYTLVITNEDNGCTAEDNITIDENITTPNAEIETPETLSCTASSVQLDGTNSDQGSNFSFEWTTQNGNYESGDDTLEPTVNAAGEYTLIITNDENGCTSAETIEVFGDNSLPIADAGLPQNLDCVTTEIDLDGENSSQNGNFLYQWVTSNGNIVSGDQTLTPNVDLGGTYVLTVTNLDNNCTATSSVIILQDDEIPTADAGEEDVINCNALTLILNGENSSQGTAFNYEWTTDDGSFIAGQNTLTPEINEGGTYILTISNTANNCISNDTVLISEDLQIPIADAGNTNELNCLIDTLVLDGSNSSIGNNIVYNWSTQDGNILSGMTDTIAQVNEPGTYQIIVLNEVNGCADTSSVDISQDIELPNADAGSTFQLDCNMPTGALNGENSSQGANFEYQWMTANGSLISGQNTLTPEVDDSGIYELLVTNIENGCTAISEIEITKDDNIPVAEALVNEGLTCEILNLEIDGTNSTQGNNISFEWTTLDGNFEANQNTLNPTINEPGTYTLTIFDANNDCEATTSVTVIQDVELPNVEAGNPFTLTCENPEFTLNPNGSSVGTNFEFEWTTPDGNFLNSPDSLMADVDQSGTYYLNIVNIENGCEALDSVIILENMVAPIIEIENPEVLTCSVLTLTLDAENSSQGTPFEYEWITSDGNILNGSNSLNPEIDQPGNYDLLITNIENGCTTISNVLVSQNVDYPDADAGETFELNCFFPELSLNGNGSIGNEFQYSWTTQNGNILSNQTTLNPEIDQPGDYELTVLNAENNCATAASVNITQNITSPIAEAGDPFILSCSVTSQDLDGVGSDLGSEFEYIWTTPNGNILAGETSLNPEINAPGIYEILVTNTQNGCTEMDQVTIQQDANAPIADAGTAEPLTCVISTIDLNGSNSSQGNEFTYNWTTQNGTIITNPNDLNIQVNQPGTYLLTVTNLDNNCETISSVIVNEDVLLPLVEAGETAQLTCETTILNLDGTDSNQGNNFQYSWTTSNGNIVSGSTSLEPEVDEPGVYELTILNTVNGCESTDFVSVGQDVLEPNASVFVGEDLTCVTETVAVLGAAIGSGTTFSFEWITANGNIISDINLAGIDVDKPGIYEVLVTDNTNGCTTVESIEVFQNTTSPIANAAVNDELDCNNLTLNLDGANSSQGINFEYLWTTSNGNILNGETTLYPQINEPGQYQILVTNNVNGCTSINDVNVNQDINPPILSIANPDLLTCTVLEVNLDASSSSQGNNFSYNWTTSNGNILSGINTSMPQINQIGTYLLTILNTENGCAETSSVDVTQDIQPPVADAGVTFVLNCFDDVQFLDGTASQSGQNISYEWTSNNGILENGTNTSTPGISSGGTYQIVVTNLQNGCTARDQVIITEDIPLAFPESDQPVCYGEKGAISIPTVTGGTSPYLYAIDGETFGNQNFFTNLEPGNYPVIVQDANGCEHEEIVQIIQPTEVTVFTTPEVEIELGDNQQLIAQTSLLNSQIAEIQWFPSETLSCSDCLTPIAIPTQSTIYTVTIRDGNGCEDQSNILVRVNKDVSVYIPNGFSPNGDGINDIFHVFAKTEGVSQVKSFLIFDRWGNGVFEDYDFQPNDPAHGWDGQHRGEEMNAAVFVYFAEIEFIDGRVELFEGDVTLVK